MKLNSKMIHPYANKFPITSLRLSLYLTKFVGAVALCYHTTCCVVTKCHNSNKISRRNWPQLW